MIVHLSNLHEHTFGLLPRERIHITRIGPLIVGVHVSPTASGALERARLPSLSRRGTGEVLLYRDDREGD